MTEEGKYPEVIFSGTYPNARQFRDIIELLSTVKEEILFSLNPESIDVLDIAVVKSPLIDFSLSKNAFHEYTLYTEPIQVAFNIETLRKWLSKTTESDLLNITFQKTKAIFMRDGGRRKLDDIPYVESKRIKQLNLPELPCSFKISTNKFSEIISDVSIGDFVTFNATESGIQFASVDGARSSIDILWNSEEGISVEKKTQASARYPVSQITSVLEKLKSLIPEISVRFGNNLPLFISGETRQYKLNNYVIAMRIP